MYWAAALALGAQLATAQTYTECNPMEENCSPNPGLATYTDFTDFTSGPDVFERWNTAAGSVTSTPLGAAFVINEQGDAPTIESDFYIFFGSVEVKMRAANGTGIISTSVLESDDLDEIDWEQVSTFDNQIQTNYFGKGNTTSYDRATTVDVSSPEEIFHTYTVNWTPTQIEWLLDGTVVRTLGYYDALGGQNYPQTPMRIRIGIWAGGDPNNAPGTISWAGGETNYADAPFTMYLESVNVVNHYPAEWYVWGDMTGSYGSIEPLNGTDGAGVPGAISKEPVAQQPGSETPTPAPAPTSEPPVSEASSEAPSPTATETPVPGPSSEAPVSEASPTPSGEAPVSGAPIPGPGSEVPSSGLPSSEVPTPSSSAAASFVPLSSSIPNPSGSTPLSTPTHTPAHLPTPTHNPPRHTPHTSPPASSTTSKPLIPAPGPQTSSGSPSSSGASAVQTMPGGAAGSFDISVAAVVGALLMAVVHF
ncbi:concanavalin A-like lectin/glucanase domain-containing protein [Aspergillus taichungensis]|uniref:Crh-like protein n=1 Tax=Aspergillus taichungensis TaxID=482145 RepID=A0A2J5I488_9EURO|nr:concanavalin A-like lectin/glucanase domain-containing protein [Aspergillus taichungensis]